MDSIVVVKQKGLWKRLTSFIKGMMFFVLSMFLGKHFYDSYYVQYVLPSMHETRKNILEWLKTTPVLRLDTKAYAYVDTLHVVIDKRYHLVHFCNMRWAVFDKDNNCIYSSFISGDGPDAEVYRQVNKLLNGVRAKLNLIMAEENLMKLRNGEL